MAFTDFRCIRSRVVLKLTPAWQAAPDMLCKCSCYLLTVTALEGPGQSAVWE